ncbi:MAG: hypothetical protein WD226_13735 [Planctomycetota bacterium]
MTSNTPKLDARIARLRRGLVRAVWLRGLGILVVCVLAWLAFAYLADWGLRVPRLIRVFHAVIVVVVTGFVAYRYLLLPLRSLPDRTGLALLLERAHGRADELFVSAVDFTDHGGNGDPELVARVLAEAEARADELHPATVLDDRRPTYFALTGACALFVAGTWAATHTELAGTFVERLLGAQRAWPQRTTLVVRVPELGDGVRVTRSGERIDVRIARGMDLPILIEAEGVVPGSVTLHIDGDRDVVLGTHSGGVFRTLLRSLQADQRFHVTGGDDDDGLPEVWIEVLEPPEVTGIALSVTPPEYSGLAPERLLDVDQVEVLRGSTVEVWVRSTPNASASIESLPAGEAIATRAAPWPDAGDAPGDVRSFTLHVTESMGFRVDLVDPEGLSSPEPPLVRLIAVEDHAPELTVLSPRTSEFEVVQGGALPLRVRAEDDFRVTGLHLIVRPLGGDGEAAPIVDRELAGTPLTLERGRKRHGLLGATRLEVDSFASDGVPVAPGQRYALELAASDNRQPEANVGNALPRRVRVVTPEELLRRLQDRLAQAKLAAVRLDELQRDRRQRVEDLLDALEGSDAVQTADSLAVAALVSGQRRVAVGAIDLARDLAAVTEDVLYARIDDKAETLLVRYDAALARWPDARFPDQLWRELAAARRAGEAGSPGFAGNLLDLVDLGLEIGDELAGRAVASLEQAANATRTVDSQEALARASEDMTRTTERLGLLLERLAEWDNFQNILALTRDIVNRQKGLKERLQNFAKERR